MKKVRSLGELAETDQLPRFEKAEVIEEGRAIGILMREFDGSISAIRIPIEQLAD